MTLINYLEDIKHLRCDWSEELPKEIINSTTAPGAPKFKVRKAWFYCVISGVGEGIREGYLGNEFVEIFRGFHNYTSETKFHHRDTTKQDIEYANRILDDIIHSIETKITDTHTQILSQARLNKPKKDKFCL